MATTIIPADQFVNVSISLDTPAGSPVNFQRALVLSDEPDFVAWMMDANGNAGGRTYELDGQASVDDLERRILANNASADIANTLNYVRTYFDQLPTPPVLLLGYVNRVVTSNDPAEYYWNVINEVILVTDIYHVFFVGNQAQLLDDVEGIALAGFFDGVAGQVYTPPSGTAVNVPVAAREVINHFQCGAPANFGPIVMTPADDDLSRKLTVNSQLYTRTQIYFPDSPTGVAPDPSNPNMPSDPAVNVDYYANALSSAVVAQLCSGSRFNRAPGALSTANLSQLRTVTTVGSRTDYPFISNMKYVPPTISQVELSAGTDRNLLFYTQTTAPNVQLTFRLGACPNEDVNGVPPRFIDQTIAIDWLKLTIIEEYFNLVVQRGQIPYTTAGFNIIRTVIEKVFERGKRLDILDPGFGPADGEIIIVPDAEDATPMQRQSRETPPILFVTRLTPRVNRLIINGTVQP